MRILVPLAAAGMAAAMIFRRLTQLIGQPENFAQVFDNIFHLNAIRYIVETGNASSLTLGSLQELTGMQAVYPAAWHTYASMTMQLTSAPLGLAENSVNIVVAALVWPIASIFLVRRIFGRNPVITLAAGIVSAAQIAFPYLLLVWGPLFPNTLSVSMLPAAIAVIVMLTGAGRRKLDDAEKLRWWIALLLSLAGLITAHMSAINALIIFVLPLLIMAFVRGIKSRSGAPAGRKAFFFGGAAVFAAVLFILWLKLRPAFYDFWGPTTTAGRAVGEALTNGPMGNEANWLVSALAILGAVTVWRTPSLRWLVCSYAIAITLYVVDASRDRGFIRNFLTGTWYQDTYRLAAFLPLFATPLAAAGVWAVGQFLLPHIRRLCDALPSRLAGRRGAWSAAGTAALTAVLAVSAYFGPTQEYIQRGMPLYALNTGSAVLTPEEFQLLDEVDDIVPEDAVIAVNPWNGSSLAYAFSGRHVLTPHLFAIPDKERDLLSRSLGTEGLTPEVCRAAELENVEYVLDFGDRYLVPDPSTVNYLGVTNVAPLPGLELVASAGENARLFEITGCGG
ncbi:hypothetical protein H9639_08800 [Arthrobacter sp. Sa2CUA1]|uniref:Glycosyltransferase RgtA/B/C/D-like domain-containing protein n=1 Tax=Arthrobacter gallicola TaxID=2762225 RepID=A0ABR8US65_9MICC|nr:hypothetical protein [Arthrobacter gallicola]